MLWMGTWVHPYTVTPVQVGVVLDPTKVGNAVMAGIGTRQNAHTPLSHLVTGNTNSK